MATLDEQLATLKAARANGYTRVRYGEKEVEYANIQRLNEAIAAVQAEIDAASATPPARVVRTYVGRGT